MFSELEKRGLIKQITNANKLRELLDNPICFYIGFDPTADSLHIGHLLQIITAKRLINAGHKAIMLIGGATALIGDPTGKSEMRKMLSRDEIMMNGEIIASQIKNITGDIRIENNLRWFEGMYFLDLIRDIGSYFSVNNMLRAECFKSRMEHGLSFLEFNYMIMQAIDFNLLNIQNNCVLQIGGDDQWSNILAGIDLCHKARKTDVFGLTLPLLTNPDGTKMGKTEKGAIWLDSSKTPVFDFFQFWRNLPDGSILPCLKMMTFISIEQINKMPFVESIEINAAKKILAFEMTKIVHGEEEAHNALKKAEELFEKQNIANLEALSIPDGIHILDALIKCGFAQSRTEGRNLINGRGVSINDAVLDDPTVLISVLKFGKEFVIKKGKKNFCRLLIEN